MTILLLCMLTSFVGCSSKTVSDTGNEEATTENVTTSESEQEDTSKKKEDTEAKPDVDVTTVDFEEEAMTGDLAITITGMEYTDKISDGSFCVTAEEGKSFVMLQMTVENKGKEAATLGNIITDSIGMYMELTIDDYTFQPKTSMLGKDLVSKTVDPLAKVSGVRYFEVSKEIIKNAKALVVGIKSQKSDKGSIVMHLPSYEEMLNQVTKLKMGDGFLVDNFKCSGIKFEFTEKISDDMWSIDAEEGEKLAMLWLNVTNEGKEAKKLLDTFGSTTRMTLVYKDEYRYDYNASLTMDKDFTVKTIDPLGTEEGYVYFAVPDVVANEGSLYVEIRNENDIREKYILPVRE